jgi:hypothetical protein
LAGQAALALSVRTAGEMSKKYVIPGIGSHFASGSKGEKESDLLTKTQSCS